MLSRIIVALLAMVLAAACSLDDNPTELERMLASCPPASDVDRIRDRIPITSESDKKELACTEVEGSRDLTIREAEVVQALLVMDKLEFRQELPWTDKPLLNWFEDSVSGVLILDLCGGGGACCAGGQVMIHSESSTSEGEPFRWVNPQNGVGLQDLIGLLVHEGRHADGSPHTCVDGDGRMTKDETLEELGAWGAQYQFNLWMAERETGFLSFGNRDYAQYVQDGFTYRAGEIVQKRICSEGR